MNVWTVLADYGSKTLVVENLSLYQPVKQFEANLLLN